MAITKEVNIVVKETGLDEVNKKVNKLETSVESLEDQQRSLSKSMGDSSQSVLDNGGAMGLLNDATGGLAMTVKDAVEASWLFTKSQKAAAIQQSIATTVVGTSTGAMKAFRIALAATGIGLIVIGLGLLIANFDKVKKAVLNFVPGLAKVGEWFGKITDAVTDFIGVTSEAERALEKFDKASQKRSDELDRKLAENGSAYSESAKKKMAIDAKLEEDLRKHIYNEQALRKEAALAKEAIDKDNAEKTAKIEKDKQDKLNQIEKDAREKKRKQLEDEKKISDEKEREDNKFKTDLLFGEIDSKRELEEENKKIQEDKFISISAEVDAIEEGNDKIKASNKKTAEDQKAIDKAVADNKLEIANLTLNLLGSLAKKGSKLAKGVAVAQATMDTYKGATAAYAAGSSLPGPAGVVGGPLMAALAVAAGFMNVKNILSTKEDGAGGGGSGSPAIPQAPSFNLVQGTGRNQIAEGLNKQAPIKAYVVPTDVSTGQSMDRNIVKSASL